MVILKVDITKIICYIVFLFLIQVMLYNGKNGTQASHNFSKPTEVMKQSSGATATATLRLSTRWMQHLDQVSQSPQTSWPKFPIELGAALNVTTTSLSYKLTKILQEGNDTHCTLWKPDQRDIPICICAVADDSFSYVSDKIRNY